MENPIEDTSTDLAWEEWGRRDPYFGVITQSRFRRTAMDENARREFFDSGELHVEYVLSTVRRYVAPEFAPHSVLDFGCGVGRTLLPFATIAQQVTGVDVSTSMLEEARRNCDRRDLKNVTLIESDDYLSKVTDLFDLVHSFIVLQHIPVRRGRTILTTLLRRLRPGGVGAIHLTYSKKNYAATNGIPPLESPSMASFPAPPDGADPLIQMNPYNMNEVLFLLQGEGADSFHAEFTDHGGELGVFLFFAISKHASG